MSAEGAGRCHSPSSFKGPGEQEKYLRTEGKPMSLQSSERARSRMQGTTDRAASPPSLEW